MKRANRISIFLLASLMLLPSCMTSPKVMSREKGMEKDSLAISFVIPGRFYAELRKEDGSYILSVPELIITGLELSAFRNSSGTLSFSNTEKGINIKLYDGYLFFSMGRCSAYAAYYEIGKIWHDYYPFS